MQSRKKLPGTDDNPKSPQPNDPALAAALQGLIGEMAYADNTRPYALVIAGPNGAGKSTLTRDVINEVGISVVDPDQLAKVLPPDSTGLNDLMVQKLLNDYRQIYAKAGKSLAYETVFSDPIGAKLLELKSMQDAGYRIYFVYVGLSSAQLSRARVLHRVTNGGHGVDVSKLSRRFEASLANGAALAKIANMTILVDNSSHDTPHRFVACLKRGVVISRAEVVPKWTESFLTENQ